MDLGYRTESYIHEPDLSWLKNPDDVFRNAVSGTIVMANDKLFKATHYPDGFIKSGTLLGLHSSGTWDTTFGPYVADQSPDTGLTAVAAVVLSGFPVKYDDDGTLATVRTHGAIALAHMPLSLYVSKLPGLLNEADAARPVVTADLPTNWADLDVVVG